jgi:hypothetical protein
MDCLFVALFYFSIFCLALSVGYYLFGILMFIVYKLDKGKLNFWQYMKRWD